MFPVMFVYTSSQAVDLLAEGVDRNDAVTIKTMVEATVDLLAEGVDRNFGGMWGGW